MLARNLLGLVLTLPLVLGGCGGDESEARQEALVPAPVREAGVTAASTTAPVAQAESSTVAVTEPSDTASAVTDEQTTLGGRDSFSYTGGPRDPFVSLLASSRVGPELPDLTLVAIYYDTRNPGSSVVVMREKINNKKYNLRPGDRLGRMRVGSVRPKDVTFTIDDFGTERQVTVSLRKQEEETP